MRRRPVGGLDLGQMADADEFGGEPRRPGQAQGHGHAEAAGRLHGEREGSQCDAAIIEREPPARARHGDEVADARRRATAEPGRIGFEPGHEGDDLHELRQRQSAEPAEGDQEDQCRDCAITGMGDDGDR